MAEIAALVTFGLVVWLVARFQMRRKAEYLATRQSDATRADLSDLGPVQLGKSERFVGRHRDLDYSVASLAALECLGIGGADGDFDEAAAYFGEVVRRATTGGRWAMDGDETVVRWRHRWRDRTRPNVRSTTLDPAATLRALVAGDLPAPLTDFSANAVAYVNDQSEANREAAGLQRGDQTWMPLHLGREALKRLRG